MESGSSHSSMISSGLGLPSFEIFVMGYRTVSAGMRAVQAVNLRKRLASWMGMIYGEGEEHWFYNKREGLAIGGWWE